jgi:hypothetical protein
MSIPFVLTNVELRVNRVLRPTAQRGEPSPSPTSPLLCGKGEGDHEDHLSFVSSDAQASLACPAF